MKSIITELQTWAKQRPNQTMYSCLDITGNETESKTYEEFYERVRIIASNISTSTELKKGDRAILLYNPGIEVLCVFFACAYLGIIPVPVYPPKFRDFKTITTTASLIAEDCQASAILTGSDFFWSPKLHDARNQVKDKKNDNYLFLTLPWFNTEDFLIIDSNEIEQHHSEILFIQYTSGSTSAPKGVSVTHSNVFANAKACYSETRLVGKPIVGVTWLPHYHDLGLIGNYLFFAILGATLYRISTSDFIKKPSLWLESISKLNANVSMAPHFGYEYCLQPGKISEECLSNLNLSSLKYLLTGAEPIQHDTFTRFAEFFKPYGLNPDSFFAAYGLAENTLAVTNYGNKLISIEREALKHRKIIVTYDAHNDKENQQLVSCGHAVGDNKVVIAHPENREKLEEGQLGEIWVNGSSKCLGYWGKPDENRNTFEARLKSDSDGQSYLRTGDLGFLFDDELYVCGRIKEMIIIRGVNYFPQDIEHMVEESFPTIKSDNVIACGVKIDDVESLILVIGIRNKKKMPDPETIARQTAGLIGNAIHSVIYVPATTIPRTSSGKKKRQQTRKMWLDGHLQIIHQYATPGEGQQQNNNTPADELAFIADIKKRYGLAGNETYSLVQAGLSSLDLTILLTDIKEALSQKGASSIANQFDASLIQEISIAELFELGEELKHKNMFELTRFKTIISRIQKEHNEAIKRKMVDDAKLVFSPGFDLYASPMASVSNTFVTGGTGFLGPFLLKSLLEQTTDHIFVLVRASSEDDAKNRLLESLGKIEALSDEIQAEFSSRVTPLCGDLTKNKFGLKNSTWNFLVNNINTIYHNGAQVNYVFNYSQMRSANVTGTNWIVRLALEGKDKIINYISTTFIFGWTVKDFLFESANNENLDLLDFGYSQTKWAAEQLIHEAREHGVNTRVFRPSLVTPSITGLGDNFDITVRLLAFMINHGISVDTQNQISFTPADIVANNIVAISNSKDTLNETFHVTKDEYTGMPEITQVLTQLTGKDFKMFSLKKFVPELIKRCTKDDLLFPLIDFLVRSVDNISAMEFKRYDNTNYQNARNNTEFGLPDPSLYETVRGIVLLLKNEGLITVDIQDEPTDSYATDSAVAEIS